MDEKEAHGFTVGDMLAAPIRLSLWQRFLIWLKSPFRCPPKEQITTYYVTEISDCNSFKIER